MRDETVARNYAETLFELALRHEGLEVYGDAIGTVARVADEQPRFRAFLETPRIPAEEKKSVVRRVFGERLPRPLVNFLLVMIDKRRQRLLRSVARQFQALVDEHLGRVHVEVTVARELDPATLETVSRELSTLLDRTAIPHVRVDPRVLGGIVVRAGDTIYDGSLRRRLDDMRRRLMSADLPAAPAGAGGTSHHAQD